MLTDLLAVTPPWVMRRLFKIMGVDPETYCDWMHDYFCPCQP